MVCVRRAEHRILDTYNVSKSCLSEVSIRADSTSIIEGESTLGDVEVSKGLLPLLPWSLRGRFPFD